MGRRRKRTIKRWTIPGRIGSVISRNGVATIRIGNRFLRSCHRPFLPEHREYCLKLLESALDEYEHERVESRFGPERAAELFPGFAAPTEVDAVEPVAPVETVHDLISRFVERRFSGMSENVQEWFRRTFAAFFPDGVADRIVVDRTSEEARERLMKHITEQNMLLAARIGDETRAKYLRHLRRLFRDAVMDQKLLTNPIDLIEIPKSAQKGRVQVYTLEHLQKIEKHYDDKTYEDQRGSNRLRVERSDKLFRLYWRWLFLTAMRFCETERMTWGDDHGTYLVVHGKRVSKERSERSFPFDVFPEARVILDKVREIRSTYTSVEPTAHVWPWRNGQDVGKELKAVKAAVKIDFGNVHRWRASAEEHWRQTLHLPDPLIADLAGHSVAVMERHYRPEQEAAKLSERVRATVHAYSEKPSGDGVVREPETYKKAA